MKKSLLCLVLVSSIIFIGCGSGKEYTSEQYQDKTVQKNCYEPENPYSESEEGHYAGYNWAEEKETSSCGGNSNSFVEGCEEYLNAVRDYKKCKE